MKKTTYIIWGVALVALGVLLGLKVLGIVDLTIFFEGWWTLFIIVPSVMGLIKDRDKTWGAIGLCVGVLLLLGARGLLSWKVAGLLIFPALIIVVGVRVLLGAVSVPSKNAAKAADDGSYSEGVGIFSSKTVSFAGREFGRADLTAVFGSVTLDLRGALIRENAVIRVYAVFGGIDILVPENLNVRIKVVPIFGGAADRRPVSLSGGDVSPVVSGTVIFGGVSVR